MLYRCVRIKGIVFTACVVALTYLASPDANAGLFGSNNYPECLLDRLPGAANDAVAQEILKSCMRDFPNNDDAAIKKKTGFFSAFPSGSECTLKKAKNTPSMMAARAVQYACYRLYEPEPVIDLEKFLAK